VVRSGTSYLSQDDMRQHFELGAAKVVDSVTVRWPDRTVTERKKVGVNGVVGVEWGSQELACSPDLGGI
jgi:hypothetical protein